MPVLTRGAAASLSRLAKKRMQQNPVDPAAVLPTSVFSHVLSFLDANSLDTARQVAVSWSAAAKDAFLWKRLCEGLWQDKVYTPLASIAQYKSWRERYYATLEDAKRVEITQDELCSFVWKFWFKQQAGAYWVGMDPYWQDEEAMQRRFTHDGDLVGVEPTTDWLAGYPCRWKFTRSKEGKKGWFVKVNAFPSLEISRGEDWGWEMENIWVQHRAALLPDDPRAPRHLLHM